MIWTIGTLIAFGLVFYFRLLPIRDINITSGVSFGFDPSVKDRILSDISFARFKRKGKLNSTSLFVLAHKKSKQYGINLISKEIWQKENKTVN